MNDPDVALTDYALALEAGLFALWVWRRRSGGGLRPWLVLFFGSTGVASLLGGTVHGFLADAGRGHAVLWRAALIAIGATALAGWGLGARLLLPPRFARWVVRLAAAEGLFYAGVVAFVSQEFRLAVLQYLPAALFLLVAFSLRWRRSREAAAALAAGGIVLSFVAAALQQLGIAAHPIWLDHNALYHVVQAAALALIFLGARGLAPSAGQGPAAGGASGAC